MERYQGDLSDKIIIFSGKAKEQPSEHKVLDLNGIQAAIFDMDGTIVNNMKYHRQAWQAFLKKFDIPLSNDEFQQQFSGKRNDQIFPIVFDRHLSMEEVRFYAEEKEKIYRRLYADHIAEIDGLRSIMQELKDRGIKLAVATSAPKAGRDFILSGLHLTEEFDVIEGEEHVQKGKPHPDIFLSVAQTLCVLPESCLVFEDTPAGIEAARQAGMRVVGLLTTHPEKELVGAELVVHNFSQLKLA